MVSREELFYETVQTKVAADALADLTGAMDPGPLEVLRLSAILVEGRAAVAVNMIELMIAERGGGKESGSMESTGE